ncbi:hypothetical protein [Brevifollis gellanilyticus]|uniref:DUF5666 domain-containing protein n=1 Tax=Brevifollis gellanilyticus TaxID=748831 RepID=A0A512MBL5_9BACT|nr:hypothetical protein [Brevifollis gellanilyticus]GEP44117.1 hypothetical protein BGE01nite_34080 [Brevifollis gellanilyticus]
MKLTLVLLAVFATFAALDSTHAADAKKAASAEAPKAAPKKGEAKAKQDTYPLYGKVVAITSRTLTIVRSDAADAPEVKFTVNASTEYVDEEKPVTIEAVKVGSWVGGSIKKAEGDGNDTVLKLNVGAKQRVAKKGTAKAPKKKAEAKTDAKKKAE